MDDASRLLEKAVKNHDKGAIIALELSQKSMPASIAASIDVLRDEGLEGIYICLRQPYGDIASLLEKESHGINGIVFISSSDFEAGNHVHISADYDVEEMIHGIVEAMSRLKSAKRFLFVDTADRIGLSLADMLKFSEYISHTVKKRELEDVILVIEMDSKRRQFIKDIAVHFDETITS